MIQNVTQTEIDGSICHQGAIMMFQLEFGQATMPFFSLPGEMIPLPS